MLDLGFLEDVERILALTPNGRQTALFSATMPPPIRELADRYLYDPVDVKVEVGDADRRHASSSSSSTSSPGDKAEKLVEVLAAEQPDQAIVFVRTKIRCDQLYRTLRDRGMNVKALHGDMSQGQRDGVMLVVQGRPRADPRRDRRRRARPRHLDRHARHQLRRADLARRLRAPHRAHRPRRALGPRDHVRRAAPEARARGDRAPHRHRRSRRGAAGAHTAPAPGRRAPAPALQAAPLAQRRRAAGQAARRRRPRRRRRGRRPRPRRDRARRASTARRCATCACSSASRSSSVPPSDAERIVDAVDGAPVNGAALRVEIARRLSAQRPRPRRGLSADLA